AVEMTIMTPDKFAPRVMGEQRNGIHAWDVWFSTTSNMNVLAARAGVLDPLTPYLVRNDVTASANWRRGKLFYASDRGPYVVIFALAYQPTGLLNTRALGSVSIEEPEDLLDPRLKGRL